MPQQLELPAKKRTTGPQPCTASTADSHVIPGLDANLCRCPACKARADGGVWWIETDQRADCLNKKKHKIPYLKQVYALIGEGIDHEDRSKQTKAQKDKRKHAEWAGEKLKPTAVETSELWS